MFRSDAFSRLQRSAMAWISFDLFCMMGTFGATGALVGPEAIIVLLFIPFIFLFLAVLMLWAPVHLVLSIAALKSAEKRERTYVLFHVVSSVLVLALFICFVPKGLVQTNLVLAPFAMVPAWLCGFIGPYLVASRSAAWD